MFSFSCIGFRFIRDEHKAFTYAQFEGHPAYRYIRVCDGLSVTKLTTLQCEKIFGDTLYATNMSAFDVIRSYSCLTDRPAATSRQQCKGMTNMLLQICEASLAEFIQQLTTYTYSYAGEKDAMLRYMQASQSIDPYLVFGAQYDNRHHAEYVENAVDMVFDRLNRSIETPHLIRFKLVKDMHLDAEVHDMLHSVQTRLFELDEHKHNLTVQNYNANDKHLTELLTRVKHFYYNQVVIPNKFDDIIPMWEEYERIKLDMNDIQTRVDVDTESRLIASKRRKSKKRKNPWT